MRYRSRINDIEFKQFLTMHVQNSFLNWYIVYIDTLHKPDSCFCFGPFKILFFSCQNKNKVQNMSLSLVIFKPISLRTYKMYSIVCGLGTCTSAHYVRVMSWLMYPLVSHGHCVDDVINECMEWQKSTYFTGYPLFDGSRLPTECDEYATWPPFICTFETDIVYVSALKPY